MVISAMFLHLWSFLFLAVLADGHGRTVAQE